MNATEAMNAQGETIKFQDVINCVENFESEQDDPDGFAEWIDGIDQTNGLEDWLENGDFATCVNAEAAAREWRYEVLIDAFWASQI